MKAICVMIALAGCTSLDTEGPGSGEPDRDDLVFEIGEPGDEPFVPLSLDCDHERALHGMTGSGPQQVGPLVLDTSGANICLSLDTRDNLLVGHFAAATEREMGEDSSYRITLMTTDGTILRDGWDVTYGGGTSAMTSAHLENGFDKGQLVDVIVNVRASAAAGSGETPVQLWLFEPYE